MNKKFWEKIKKYNIVVVAHESSEGPPQELRDFFLSKNVKKVVYISHPLLYLKELYKESSRFVEYSEGKRIKNGSAVHWILPEPFLYIKDVLYTLVWCLQSKNSFDLFFGADPLNAFSGILLRNFGVVKKVVYYSIDYSPKRFENRFLNFIYHFFDKFCCYYSDYNWVGTERTTQARIASGLIREKMAKIIIVPDGTHSMPLSSMDFSSIHLNTIVYVGFMLEKQGIDLILDSMQDLKKKINDIKLIMIGKGPYLPQIHQKITKLKLQDAVEFKGFIKDNKELQSILNHTAVGLAPYIEDKDSYTYYSPAGKPVLYLGCGLPVVITDVPYIAREIHERKAGVIIRYNKKDFIEAVFSLLGNLEKYREYKKNAALFGQELNWYSIFEKACYSTLNKNLHEKN